MRFKAIILLLILILCIGNASAAMSPFVNGTSGTLVVNVTTVMNDAPGTPFEFWTASIILALAMMFLSFFTYRHGEEGLIAIMAIWPAAFAFATSFNLRINEGSQMVYDATMGSTIYLQKYSLVHFDWIAWTCMMPLFVFQIINVGRIWINTQKMKEVASINADPGTPSQE